MTDPVRATYDAMKAARTLVEAVVELEKSVMARIVSLEEMAAYAETRAGSSGIRLVRAALPLASEFSRSPQEVRTRFVAEQVARLPPLLVNATAVDVRGIEIGEVDLADPSSGLVIEFDGADHESAPRRHFDAVKLERLRAAGADVLRVTSPMLARPADLAATMRAARERALAAPDGLRHWRFIPRERSLHEQLMKERVLAELNVSLERREH